jgi:hypothetical protein
MIAITVSDVTSVPISDAVKSLGPTIDSTLSFNRHVSNICKATYYHIKAMHHIWHCISPDDAEAVTVALVSSRFGYCNAILYHMTAQT